MMNFDCDDLKVQFQQAFGIDSAQLTVEQAWVLVKIIKHCRGRCRNNSALNNYLNRNFPGLRFEQVTVPGKGDEDYETLKISSRNRLGGSVVNRESV